VTSTIARDVTSAAAYSDTIRSYIVENIFLGQDVELGDSDSLYESGVLDSTAVMELVAFLESHFDITIDDEDLTESNLGSIDSAGKLVERKLGGAREA
jgi:acyl carrier protein